MVRIIRVEMGINPLNIGFPVDIDLNQVESEYLSNP